MNATEFVDVIRAVVRDNAASGTVELLQQPPGRQPPKDVVALSHWFHELTDADKGRVYEVAAMASHAATFGFLAVLDGVRAIQRAEERGSLELHYVDGEGTVLINAPTGPMLHDLL